MSPAALGQACNDPPVALADEASFFGGPVVVDVLANDTDPDGEALEVFGLTTTCPGTVSEDFGLVTAVLNVSTLENDCTLGYFVQDERGATDSSSVTIRDATRLFQDGFEAGDPSNWIVGS